MLQGTLKRARHEHNMTIEVGKSSRLVDPAVQSSLQGVVETMEYTD